MGNDCLYGKTDFATANQHQYDGDAPSDTARQVGLRQSFERLEKRVRRCRAATAGSRWVPMCSMLSLLSLLLGGPVLAWVRTVYTPLSGTNDRAPFRSERTGNFPVAANETAADMLCCALYPRIQTFPSTDLRLHGGDLVSRGVDALTIRKNVWVGR